jgi:hypothetical protein
MRSTWAGIPPTGVAQSVDFAGPGPAGAFFFDHLPHSVDAIVLALVWFPAHILYDFRPASQSVELTKATAEISHPSQIRICGASLRLSHITIIPVQLKAR